MTILQLTPLPFPLPPGFSLEQYPEEVNKAANGDASPLFAKAASFIEETPDVCDKCQQIKQTCPTWQLAMIYRRMFAEEV